MTGRMIIGIWVFAALLAGGCSESAGISVESQLARGEAAIAQGESRTATLHLRSVLQSDPYNVRARWLLGKAYLAMEQGALAEKEIRRAAELGVGADATVSALAQALVLQGKADEVLALELPGYPSQSVIGQLYAARGLAKLQKEESREADALSNEALKYAGNDRFVQMARARVLIDVERLSEAEQLVATLMDTHPQYGVAWSLQGDIENMRGDLQKAVSAYSDAIEKREQPYQDRLKRALLLFRLDEIDRTLVDAKILNEALPNLQSAWFLTGAAHFVQKDFAQAQEPLDRAFQLNSKHLPTVVMLAWTQLNLGNENQAVTAAERAIALEPDVYVSRVLMATIRARQGRYLEAEKFIRPVVNGRPDDQVAKSLLVDILRAQGKSQDALPLLDDMAAANPQSIDVQAVLAAELVRSLQPSKAAAVLERIALEVPQDPRIHGTRVAALIQQRRFDTAVAMAQSFVDRNPDSAIGYRILSVAQIAKGDTYNGIASLRQALEILPNDPALTLLLADFLRLDGDLSSAVKVVDKTLEVHPDNIDLVTRKASLALFEGRNDEAMAGLREALEIDPSSRIARQLLGQQLLARNDLPAALAVLSPAAGDDDPDLLALLITTRLRVGDPDAALNDALRLVELAPESALAHSMLGQVYAALGQQYAMEASIQKAADLDPSNKGFVLANARVLVVKGRIDEAEAAVNRLELSNTDPGLLSTRLIIAGARGDQVERLRLARLLQEMEPSTQNVLLLAQAHALNRQIDESGRIMARWVEQNPGDETVGLQLAALYERYEKPEHARGVLRHLAEARPDSGRVLSEFSRQLREIDPLQSLVLAERAVQLEPNDASVQSNYSIALTLNGHHADALRAVDVALQQYPRSSLLHLQKIEILLKAGELDAAKEAMIAIKREDVPVVFERWLAALREQTGLASQ